MEFEILGDISNIEKIAVKTSIRDLQRLRRMYGKGRWRKLKGMARIQLPNGKVRMAEVHWYEAHGIGRREIRWKRYLD
ncbi:MAG: hypothetical protein DMG13_10010 [Acidobacteria bacterium]|nr:MAG: hypothetical protein DMG13_10010 [Acidobacteriota bacterium]